MGRKLAVLFPGIGYTVDRPLLYYSGRLCREFGYEVKAVSFSGLTLSKETVRAQIPKAAGQAAGQLKEMDPDSYDRILFVSKSVGTAAACAAASQMGIPAGQVLLTPLEATFDFVSKGAGIAFSGTKDQWADFESIRDLCRKKEIPLYVTENGNHSLECGKTKTDIETAARVIGQIREYLESWEGSRDVI